MPWILVCVIKPGTNRNSRLLLRHLPLLRTVCLAGVHQGFVERLRRGAFSFLLCLLIGMLLTPTVRGQRGMNRAGLIIQHGDGTVFTTCVAFDEPSISGLELLIRAGVSVSADSSSGFGTTVCALDGEGCNYPDQSCFCQCEGASCTYWVYWHLVSGEWQYSQLGAADWQITDGSVDGWVWGQGDPGGGEKPPATSFDEICRVEPTNTPLATPSHRPTRKPQATASNVSSRATSARSTPAATPPRTRPADSTATPAGAASPSQGTSGINYVVFAAIVLALAVLIVRQLRPT